MAKSAVRIGVFASGAGSNYLKLLEEFEGDARISLPLLICNKPEAGATEHAANWGKDILIIDKSDWAEPNKLIQVMKGYDLDLLVLAGFLWLLPEEMISAWPRAIVNLHPALLPKFGGRGMYGSRVHQAVLDAGEGKTGITIHYADGHYDSGDIIAQQSIPVSITDTAETLASRIHALEHQVLPRIIRELSEALLSQSAD